MPRPCKPSRHSLAWPKSDLRSDHSAGLKIQNGENQVLSLCLLVQVRVPTSLNPARQGPRPAGGTSSLIRFGPGAVTLTRTLNAAVKLKINLTRSTVSGVQQGLRMRFDQVSRHCSCTFQEPNLLPSFLSQMFER